MELEDIIRILTIRDEGSLNKAAEKLYISQSALTKCLKRAEQYYGITLFERSKGEMLKLTDEGSEFMEMAESILYAQNRFIEKLQEKKKNSQTVIKVGVTPERTRTVIPKILTWFYKYSSDVSLQIQNGSSSEILRKLYSGEVDCILLGSVITQYPGLHYERICERKQYVVIGEMLKKTGKIRTEAVDGEDVVRFRDLKDVVVAVNKKGSGSRMLFDQLVQKTGVVIPIKEITNHAARMYEVKTGRCVCLISDLGAVMNDRDVQLIPLHPEDSIRAWDCTVTINGKENKEYFRKMTEASKAAADGLEE